MVLPTGSYLYPSALLYQHPHQKDLCSICNSFLGGLRGIVVGGLPEIGRPWPIQNLGLLFHCYFIPHGMATLLLYPERQLRVLDMADQCGRGLVVLS